MTEESTVQHNLMNQAGYSPYCGAAKCEKGMPRTQWDPVRQQFRCSCGWVSGFSPDFIERYIAKWKK